MSIGTAGGASMSIAVLGSAGAASVVVAGFKPLRMPLLLESSRNGSSSGAFLEYSGGSEALLEAIPSTPLSWLEDWWRLGVSGSTTGSI